MANRSKVDDYNYFDRDALKHESACPQARGVTSVTLTRDAVKLNTRVTIMTHLISLVCSSSLKACKIQYSISVYVFSLVFQQ